MNWTYQTPNNVALVAATDGGGLAINDSVNGIIHFDTSGGSTQVTGAVGTVPQYSWGGEWSLQRPDGTSGVVLPIGVDPADIWATPNGSPSQNSAPGALCECLVQQSSDPEQGLLSLPRPLLEQHSTATLTQSSLVPNCPMCDLNSPTAPNTSCTTPTGSGPTYLILIGDPGLDSHNAHKNFALSAQQNGIELNTQGKRVIGCRVSTVQDINNALEQNAPIDGGVIYYGHSGPHDYYDANGIIFQTLSILAVGQGQGFYTNVEYDNANLITNSALGAAAAATLNGCNTTTKVVGLRAGQDPAGLSQTPIAKVLARQFQRRVFGYPVGTYFSDVNAQNATTFGWVKGQEPLPQLPMYLIPQGAPGHKPPLYICDPIGECRKP